MNHSPHKSRADEQGYILLTLLLFVALLSIAAISIAPTIEFQVRRDREEELIHRGTQYSRAIQHYYKKFNRYPSKIEDLESSNNLHFLRKRYKDPITGEDFKLVHFGEGQLPTAVTNAGASGQPGAKGSNSGFGSSATSNASSSPASSTDTGADPSSSSSNPSAPSSGFPSSAGGSSVTTGFGSPGNSSASTSKDKLAGKTFGGGPIVGVVSTSKAESIREFAKKNHYNDWQFIYDPTADSGGLLSVPNQTGSQAAGMQGAPGVRGNQGVLGGMGPGNMGGAGNTGFGGGFGNPGSGNSGPGNSGSPFGAPSQQPQR